MFNLTGAIKALTKERDQTEKTLRRLDNALKVLKHLAHRTGATRKSGSSSGRTLSAQARKRIAAAQRRRWAEWKKSRGNRTKA